ncbi:MAG: hypothetical protein RBT37_09815, partial [Dissulfurispiraceae bacterium]|nr:hypothetical protein [Dissulfurispiraceae bacterium]
MDNTPTIQITSPAEGSVQTGPFEYLASATFKPTLSSSKGIIYCYYGTPTNPSSGLIMHKNCTTESCTIKHSELKGKLWEPPTGEYGAYCRADGVGNVGIVGDTKNFKVDRVPTIQIISPEDGSVQTGPFDVKVTATFKPTLNSAKGSINCYYGSPTNPTNLFLSKQCTTESCTIKHSELKGKLWEPPTGEYGVVCKATAGSNGSANDTKNFKVDRVPTIQITSPAEGSVQTGPFDVKATAIFKPTLNNAKGSISCYYGSPTNPTNLFLSKQCTTESCTIKHSELKGKLWEPPTGEYGVVCKATAGSNGSANDTKNFKVDRVPTIQIISPEDGSVQTGPFDVKVTATFKPTLNS